MRKIYTSIDIGNDTIRILVGEYFAGKVRTLAVSSVKTKGLVCGDISDIDLLEERIKIALDDIFSRINIKIKKVILTIPSFDAEFNLAHGNVPIINDEKMITIKDVSRVESSITKDIALNMEIVNVTPIDYTIFENGSEIETIKNPINKICDRLSVRAMLVLVPKTRIIPYVKAIEACGLEVVDICLAPICDFEEIKIPDYEDSTTSIINIGKDTTTISIFNKGIITNSKTLKMGSKIIDEDISYIYNLNRKSAKKVKEEFGVAHPRYSSKSETYEIKDINDKIISINQYEVSEIINKRITEILNVAKNELKVLTNKEISYIMVLGGITDIPAINFVIEDVIGSNAKNYSLSSLGIRKSRFITSSGAIKYFVRKLKFKGKDYSMFSSDDIEGLVHSKTKIGKEESVFGRFFNYFFDN